MASSVVDVCNLGLTLLGVRPIASLTEGTKAASLAEKTFADERDATFRAGNWRFARKRAALAKDPDAPIGDEWTASFQLPTNPYCVRVLKLLGTASSDAPWAIEGRKLLTNADECKILFIARIDAVPEWDALFTSALGARLAMTWSYPLTEQVQLQKSMAELYTFKMSEARSIDSQESSTQDTGSDALVEVRFGGVHGRRSGWTMDV